MYEALKSVPKAVKDLSTEDKKQQWRETRNGLSELSILQPHCRHLPGAERAGSLGQIFLECMKFMSLKMVRMAVSQPQLISLETVV